MIIIILFIFFNCATKYIFVNYQYKNKIKIRTIITFQFSTDGETTAKHEEQQNKQKCSRK